MEFNDTLREQVKEILTDQPLARDSDAVLRYYWLVAHFKDPRLLTAHELLRAIEHGTIPKMEAVTRTRRWVQDAEPALRGTKYEARSEHQDRVVEELGYGVPAHAR
jgi:hypothetical protein